MPAVRALILLFLAGCLSTGGEAAEFQYLVQAGANQGLLALGIAGDHDSYVWAASYGMTPSEEGQNVITQWNLKGGVEIFEGTDLRAFAGGALLVNASSETFFELPDEYPDGYYPPNAYFLAMNLGVVARNGFFVEVSMLDYYIEVLAKNPRGSVSNMEVLSFGFGRVF